MEGVCVLLVGTLPGPAEQDVLDHFDVLRVDGLDPPPPDIAAQAESVRGMAVGMMAYHGPSVRVSDAYMRRFPALEIVANFGVGYDAVDVSSLVAAFVLQRCSRPYSGTSTRFGRFTNS